MSVLFVRPAGGGEVDRQTFADITAVPVADIAWRDAWLRIEFAADLTAAEAVAVRCRVMSGSPREEQMRRELVVFLDVPTPTGADVVVQVRRLTRLILSLD